MIDEIEFEQRTRACTEKLFHVCYTLLPERVDRDDAIQEAIIKAWKKRGTLKDDTLFEVWLMHIAINECRDMLRHRKHHPETEIFETIPASETFHDIDLHNALRKLDKKLRIPFVLHYVDGYTVDEISRIVGSPVGTVKHWLMNARTFLKEELGEE